MIALLEQLTLSKSAAVFETLGEFTNAMVVRVDCEKANDTVC